MQFTRGILLSTLISLFAATPSSTNFTLKTYDFGNGGGSGSSTSYKLNGGTNGQSGSTATSTNYTGKPGLSPTIDANVPTATFTNPDTSYNRLQLIVNPANNPSTATFAIAISPDNFASTTRYVQSDNSVGVALGSEDRQTYAAWGGASGIWVTGLLPSTTYTVKLKAFSGNFTETAYGPTVQATTSILALTFSLTTTLTPTPPFSAAFGTLTPGSVNTATADATIALSTNSSLGGEVFAYDSQGGLRSAKNAFTLSSATTDLSVAATGYGAQVTATSQTSGGPFTSVSPFNGAGSNVGILSTTIQKILATPGPVTSGSATIRFKAKPSATTPAGSDYADTVTFVASMSY